MEKQGLYYAVFRLEKPGFKPVTLQGIYEPSGNMASPEMRLELYQAVQEFVKSRLKTERFKLKLVGLTRLKTDFVYTPGRTKREQPGSSIKPAADEEADKAEKPE